MFNILMIILILLQPILLFCVVKVHSILQDLLDVIVIQNKIIENYELEEFEKELEQIKKEGYVEFQGML